MSTNVAPILVLDVGEDTWGPIHADKVRYSALIQWMKGYGLNPDKIYRLEFFLVDTPFARVFEFEWDDQGRTLLRDGGAARQEPYALALSDFPPAVVTGG